MFYFRPTVGTTLLFLLLPLYLAAGGKASDQKNPAPEKEAESYYVISGKRYERAEVWANYRKARKTYGVDMTSRQIRPLKSMKAIRVSGTPIQRSASQVIFKTDSKGIIAVTMRNGHELKPDQASSLAVDKRRATIKVRLQGGETHSVRQYSDVSFLPGDLITALNNGQNLKGVSLKAVETRDERLEVWNRPKTQFDSRTTTVE